MIATQSVTKNQLNLFGTIFACAILYTAIWIRLRMLAAVGQQSQGKF
jgi:hypothetical protein